MRSVILSLVLLPLLLAGCAAAATPPVLSENFEAPLTNNYTVLRQGQALATASNVWQVTAASVDLVNVSVRREAAASDGQLVGDTITGEWYSHYARKGWYRYVGGVLTDGSIDQSQSDAPIRSNMKTAVLTRKP